MSTLTFYSQAPPAFQARVHGYLAHQLRNAEANFKVEFEKLKAHLGEYEVTTETTRNLFMPALVKRNYDVLFSTTPNVIRGHIGLQRHPEAWKVFVVEVAPEFQRMGFGCELANGVVDAARHDNYAEVWFGDGGEDSRARLDGMVAKAFRQRPDVELYNIRNVRHRQN